jgi:hypothetical protein
MNTVQTMLFCAGHDGRAARLTRPPPRIPCLRIILCPGWATCDTRHLLLSFNPLEHVTRNRSDGFCHVAEPLGGRLNDDPGRKLEEPLGSSQAAKPVGVRCRAQTYPKRNGRATNYRYSTATPVIPATTIKPTTITTKYPVTHTNVSPPPARVQLRVRRHKEGHRHRRRDARRVRHLERRQHALRQRQPRMEPPPDRQRRQHLRSPSKQLSYTPLPAYPPPPTKAGCHMPLAPAHSRNPTSPHACGALMARRCAELAHHWCASGAYVTRDRRGTGARLSRHRRKPGASPRETAASQALQPSNRSKLSTSSTAPVTKVPRHDR